jgi:hypothetical protein
VELLAHIAKSIVQVRATEGSSKVAKQSKEVRRTRVDGILYPYDDAKKDVTIERDLVDVWKGVPGNATECMNAQCIIRNKAKFPHKVLAASVIKTRVFIFDSPNHLVRYVLSSQDSRLIEAHDSKAIGQPGTLRLRAPHGHDVAGDSHGAKDSRPSGPHSGTRDKSLVRGEKARVLAAVGAGK